MQSLFSNKEEKKEDKNSVKLNITLLMEEFADYVNSIKKIKECQFEFCEKEGEFKYDLQD